MYSIDTLLTTSWKLNQKNTIPNFSFFRIILLIKLLSTHSDLVNNASDDNYISSSLLSESLRIFESMKCYSYFTFDFIKSKLLQCYQCEGIENENTACAKEELNEEVECEDGCSLVLEDKSNTMFLQIWLPQIKSNLSMYSNILYSIIC